MIALAVYHERKAWDAYRAYVVAALSRLNGGAQFFDGDSHSAHLFQLWRAARARREAA